MPNQDKILTKNKTAGLNLRRVIVLTFLLVLGSIGIFYVIYRFSLTARQKIIASHFTPTQFISLEAKTLSGGEEGSTEGDKKLPLRIAIAPVVSPEASLTLYKNLVDYLAKALDREGVIILRPSYAEINDLLRHGRCELAFVCTYSYVRGKLDFGLQLLAIPMINGKTTYHSWFIVPSSSKVGSLLELKGKRFASADILSNSGWLYPAIWLKNQGEKPEGFFSQHIIARSHDRSVYLVAYEYVDGAAVDSIVYEQMPEEIRQRTRVIFKSPPFGMPPLVVPPGINHELKNQLLHILLNMHQDPQGKSALSPLGIERFVTADEKLYQSVEEMVNIWESRR